MVPHLTLLPSFVIHLAVTQARYLMFLWSSSIWLQITAYYFS